MCLIGVAVESHPDFPLIVIANRDEFHNRETARANWWQDDPDILGGIDLKAGGTWMAVHRDGRWGCVTNYRDLRFPEKQHAPSRGELIPDWLKGDMPAETYLSRLAPNASQYNGFNLLLGDGSEVMHFSNRENKINRLKPGIHGLSNHLLDTLWPKVKTLKSDLQNFVLQEKISSESLFAMLQNRQIAPDDHLPSTGVSIDWERKLSAMFIESEGYGTRVSTVMTVDRVGQLYFEERSFVPAGDPATFEWKLYPNNP